MGIRRVVIATPDDTEKAAGKGIKILSDNKLDVSVGCLAGPARRINAGFFKLNRGGRPLVILKWAQSLDGKLNWPKALNRRWITGEPARRHVHRLRSQCGAILVGIGTVLADDPELTVRLKGNHHPPIRAVLDGHLRTPLESRILNTPQGGKVILYTRHVTMNRCRNHLENLLALGVEVVGVESNGGHQLDLTAVLDDLGRRGITDLLVEGGQKVHDSFISSGLADRWMTYVAAVLIGSAADVKTLNGSNTAPSAKVVRVKRLGQDVLIEADIEPFEGNR